MQFKVGDKVITRDEGYCGVVFDFDKHANGCFLDIEGLAYRPWYPNEKLIHADDVVKMADDQLVTEHDRFEFVKFDDEIKECQKVFKSMFKCLELEIDKIAPGRAKSIVYTKLEEAYMWVGKALKEEQIDRNKITKLKLSDR